MKTSATDLAFDISNSIMTNVINDNPVLEHLTVKQTNGLKVMMSPIISNAIFKRENELLEKERFRTLIILARVLNDDNLEKSIEALGYTLTTKTPRP